MLESYFDTESFIKIGHNPTHTPLEFIESGTMINIHYYNYANFYRISTNYLHMHSEYEVCLVIDGSGVFKHGDCLYPLKSGTLFIADPFVLHEITSYQSKNLYLFFFKMGIQKNIPSTVPSILKLFLKSHKIVEYDCHDLLHYLPLINRSYKTSDERKLCSENLFRTFVFDIFERLSNNLTIITSTRAAQNTVVVTGEVFLINHMSIPVSVSSLASACHISQRQLRRIIRTQFNKTVKDWIKDKKLNHARNLLDKQYPIQEVCEKCGFKDPNNFSQMFKKHYGLTPRFYKKVNLETRVP